MKTHADKTQRTKWQTPAHSGASPRRLTGPAEHIADSRPEALAQGALQAMANTSLQILQLKAYQQMADSRPAIQHKTNNTGLPDTLKTGIENLSGFSMDDVRVHYNSDKPAQLQALAYAQGMEIHMAPGQERYLPHEAWHVVQQMQGRVQPTRQMKGGVQVNDDAGLEREADVMGGKTKQLKLNLNHETGCNCSGCTAKELASRSNNSSAFGRPNAIQMVRPPNPQVDTSTLKGKVIDRAFRNNEVQWIDSIERWMFKCYYCQKLITEEAVNADHYPIPQRAGGQDSLSNLVLACSPCNSSDYHNKKQMVTRGQAQRAGEERKYT